MGLLTVEEVGEQATEAEGKYKIALRILAEDYCEKCHHAGMDVLYESALERVTDRVEKEYEYWKDK